MERCVISGLVQSGTVASRLVPKGIWNADPKLLVLIIIAVATAFHLMTAGASGLGSDEAYTVSNARVLAWSYVDYPPLHVWLVAAWSWLIGNGEFDLRLPFVLLFAGTTWLMYSLTALLFSERAGFWSALALNLAPVYAIAHGVWILPDGLLTFLLLAGALVVAERLFGRSEPSSDLRGWLCAGVLTGLAMLTKYHGAFLAAGTLVFLLTWKPGRQILCSPSPWLGAVVALVIFLPVIVWNAQHDWLGLFFQSRRLTKSVDLSLVRVLANIAEQAGYLSPWLFVPMTIALWRALHAGTRSKETWFLAMLAVGPIVLFTSGNLFARGLPHWSMPGWLFVFPLLGREIAYWEVRHSRILHRIAAAVILVMVFLVGMFVSQASSGWITSDMSSRVRATDPTLDLLSWREVWTVILDRGLVNSSTPAVAGLRWMDAGKLNYEIGRAVPVLCLCDDPQQFGVLQNLSQFAGRDILVIQPQGKFERDPAQVRAWFERIQPLAPIVLHRGTDVALTLAVFRGIGLKPFPSTFTHSSAPYHNHS